VRIKIMGGNGVVGFGIRTALSGLNAVSISGRESYDVEAGRYSSSALSECDCLVHAAGVTDEEVASDQRMAIQRATAAAIELFDEAARAGCTHLVYASSMHVYGPLINTGAVIDERVCPTPGNVYGFCHLATEWALRHVAAKHGLNGLIVRLGAVYGFPAPGSRINRLQLVPYDFPSQLIEDQTIVLKTTGDQRRSFCSNAHVGQLVSDWLGKAAHTSGLTVENVRGEATMSVREFAHVCAAVYESVTGRRGEVEIPGPERSVLREPIALGDIPVSLKQFLAAYLESQAPDSTRRGH
jgi:nucleoside-diphosphate-sugar epimerase